MGQARIVRGGPTGLYDIEIIQETSKATARLQAINERIEGTDGNPDTSPPIPASKGLRTAIRVAAAAVTSATAALDAAMAALDLSINQKNNPPATLIAVPRWDNDGNGTCTGVTPGDICQVGRYTLLYGTIIPGDYSTSPVIPDAAGFTIYDPSGFNVDSTRIGSYSGPHLKFTTSQGTSAFSSGDAFDIDVTEETKAPITPVSKAQAAAVAAQNSLVEKRRIFNNLNLELVSLDKEEWAIKKAIEKVTCYDVWCADLTENLAVGAIVGTIEINGEGSGRLLIMPGGATGLGKIQPVMASTPAGVFYNWAILACWQKWRPTYRIGVIKAFSLAPNKCNVCVEEARSSVRGILINQAGIKCFATIIPTVGAKGFEAFAAKYPNHPIVTNTTDATVPMTDQLRKDMDEANRSVNSNSNYKKDIDQYGNLEKWDFMSPGGSGDCEDFALTKLQKLLNKGYPIGALKLTTGNGPNGAGHAWLTVQTDEGDFGLDNNYSKVMPSDQMNYTNVAKQTGMIWGKPGVLLSDVPIEYMSGVDAAAFFVGDRVIVAFTGQSWSAPKVIGFESNPRGLLGYLLISYLDVAANRHKVRLYKILPTSATLLTTSITPHNSLFSNFGLWWDTFNNGIGFQTSRSGSNYYTMSKDFAYIKSGAFPAGYGLRSSAVTSANEQIFLLVSTDGSSVKVLDKNYVIIKSFNVPSIGDPASFALLPDSSIIYKVASADPGVATMLHFCADGVETASRVFWGALEVPTFSQVHGAYFLTNMAGGSMWMIHGSIPTSKVFLSPLSNPGSRTTIAESGKYTFTYTSYAVDGTPNPSLTVEASVTLSACITADGNFIVVTQPDINIPEVVTYFPPEYGGGVYDRWSAQILAGWCKVYSISGAFLYNIPATDMSGSVQMIGAKIRDIGAFTA